MLAMHTGENHSEVVESAGDASAADNGNKAAVPVGGIGNSMWGKSMPSQLEMLERWTKFARRRCQFETREREHEGEEVKRNERAKEKK